MTNIAVAATNTLLFVSKWLIRKQTFSAEKVVTVQYSIFETQEVDKFMRIRNSKFHLIYIEFQRVNLFIPALYLCCACLSIYLYVCLSACLSVCLSTCLSVCLPACLPVYLFVAKKLSYKSVYMSS